MRVARNMHTVHSAHDVRVRNVDSVRNVHNVAGHDGKNDDKPSPRHRGVSRKPDTQGVHTTAPQKMPQPTLIVLVIDEKLGCYHSLSLLIHKFIVVGSTCPGTRSCGRPPRVDEACNAGVGCYMYMYMC